MEAHWSQLGYINVKGWHEGDVPFFSLIPSCTKASVIPRRRGIQCPIFTLGMHWIKICTSCKCVLIMSRVDPHQLNYMSSFVNDVIL